MQREISTRAELIDALRIASELEHQLMAQYLFAVYSLKRYTYEGLDPVQIERVRRLSSSITLIARQEMEHLGLALNLLSSIGGTPSFTRPNMPQKADYYGKAGIKLELTRGNLATIKRFQRFEAPDKLTKRLSPGEDVDQSDARDWCRKEEVSSRAGLIAMLDGAPKEKAAPMPSFDWDSVQSCTRPSATASSRSPPRWARKTSSSAGRRCRSSAARADDIRSARWTTSISTASTSSA
jgi:ferritin-like protein